MAIKSKTDYINGLLKALNLAESCASLREACVEIMNEIDYINSEE
jgi:hypothetical protein